MFIEKQFHYIQRRRARARTGCFASLSSIRSYFGYFLFPVKPAHNSRLYLDFSVDASIVYALGAHSCSSERMRSREPGL